MRPRPHAASVGADFAFDDILPNPEDEVTFTATSESIAHDDQRGRAYVDAYDIEDVKIDGVEATAEQAKVIEAKARDLHDDAILERLDEELWESAPDVGDRGAEE
jgi:hypothetical protein